MVDVYSWFETSSCIETSVMMPTTEKPRSKQTDQPNGTIFGKIAMFEPVRSAGKSGSSRCRYILQTCELE